MSWIVHIVFCVFLLLGLMNGWFPTAVQRDISLPFGLSLNNEKTLAARVITLLLFGGQGAAVSFDTVETLRF